MRAVRLRTSRTADGGFSLIEVMIAMVVFMMISISALGLLLAATGAARANSSSSVAAGLAARQLESARGQRAIDIPDGAVTRTETISNVSYSITQTATYVAADSTVSLCSGGSGRLAYKLITVVVTWPDMGRAQPVRADTLRVVGVGDDGLDGGSGVLAIAVRTGLDAPVPGVQVSLAPVGTVRTTGIDGCAVFVGLTPGGYTVTPSAIGHVDSVNNLTPTATPVTATAGAVSRATLLYDAALSVATTPGGPVGYVAPESGLPVTVRSSYLSARTLPACPPSGSAVGCVTGNPPRLTGIFPAVYSLWLGTCRDAAVATGVDLTTLPASATTTIGAGAVLIDVTVFGTSTAGRTVTATHAPDSEGEGGCPAGESYILPATEVGGAGVLLPYGTWTFSTAGATPVTATLTSSGPVTVTLAATE